MLTILSPLSVVGTSQTVVKTNMTSEHLSPSGKYRLVVESIPTKPGCLNYTRGTVYKGNEVVTKVERNYSAFPFLFIEDHQDGYDYLVCGADYQGQTVVRLNDGEVRNNLPPEATEGIAFCWADYTYNKEHNLLVVDGCHWACPYEYRFYDFSEPMAGWQELKFQDPENYADSEGVPPKVENGFITCYETRISNEDDLEAEEDTYNIVAHKKYKIENNQLVLVEEWVDEKEKVRRAEFKIAREKYEAALAKYKAEDPLYLLAKEAIESKVFGEPVPYGHGIGQCYDKWHPTENFYGSDGRLDQRICFDLVRQSKTDKSNKLTIELEWGREKAPIKVRVYRDDRQGIDTWFEHSIEGMKQAIEFAKEQSNV